jgi:hypothetical protein
VKKESSLRKFPDKVAIMLEIFIVLGIGLAVIALIRAVIMAAKGTSSSDQLGSSHDSSFQPGSHFFHSDSSDYHHDSSHHHHDDSGHDSGGDSGGGDGGGGGD